jgi:hypothetical protein
MQIIYRRSRLIILPLSNAIYFNIAKLNTTIKDTKILRIV